MPSALFDDMKHRIGFTEDDVGHLRALAPVFAPHFEALTDDFYRWLFADPRALMVFAGGREQIERQRAAFIRWLDELFGGDYGEAYYRSRLAIGQTHVRVGLSQHYMFVAMEHIWQSLRELAMKLQVPDISAKMASLHKLLTLETAVMLESYKESYSSQIREEERSVAEERLTRSEHLATIGQLAASLAHEIKNPLAGISGAIQVIRDGMKLDDPHRAVIHEILGQIDRLDAAVKDLLIYARPKPPELAACDLPALIARVIKLMRDTPTFRRIPITFQADDRVRYVTADAHQLEQLLMNLLVNAAQASHEGAPIEISLSVWEGKVRMVILDRGCGMDENIVGRCFEPFFTTKVKGTGLGLSICKKIVDAHHGTIRLKSAAGVGTEVTIELPQSQTREGEKVGK